MYYTWSKELFLPAQLWTSQSSLREFFMKLEQSLFLLEPLGCLKGSMWKAFR